MRITSWPSSASYPLAISSKDTSSPQTLQIRLYRIRPPSSRCTWWNETSLLWVAVYIFTGTFTSPNETEPFHIALTGTGWTRAAHARHCQRRRRVAAVR